MEPKELSPALLQPQVTVVATLGELLATLPTREEETLLECPKRLYRDLEEFTKELWVTLHCIDDSWRHRIVTDDDDDPVTSLSQALAAYTSTPRTTQDRVAMAARKWQWSVSVLVDSWAELARKATELRDTWSKVATEALTAQFGELQEKAVHYGTAKGHMVGLGQALGGKEGAKAAARTEFSEAMVATSETIVATMVRERVWAAQGLLERLVAACDKATAFPWELQRLLGDTKTALERTKKKFPTVPEGLVAKVAEAERLWEATARLAKDHLLGAVHDFLDYYRKGGRARPRARGVPKWCQRATEDISRLLQPLERAQSVPKVSPVSTEPQELSPTLLQPQVTVVATLGELLATLPTQEEEMMLESPKGLKRDLEAFTEELRVTLQPTEDTWRRHIVTDDDDGGGPVTSLSRALAAFKSTPGTTQDRVAMAAKEWQWSLAALEKSWAQLARKATELRDTCRVAVTEAATAMARELQAKAAGDGTAQKHSVELAQALGGEEGAKVAAGQRAQEREEATEAASEARRARQRLEAALGLLERLVAACDEATAFPRELQCLIWDTRVALKETNEASPNVPEGLVAKVAEAERLWEANARLAKDHLLGAVDDFLDFYSKGGRARPRARGVPKWCLRVIEDIPRLLQPLERAQSVPKVSPVSTEPQELSPALLQPQVTVVATLGELLDTLPTQEEEMMLESSKGLNRDLEAFTEELRVTLQPTEDTWRRHIVTDDDDDPVTSLSRALAAYKSTPGTSRDDVAMAASEWHQSVSVLVDRWAQVTRKATELRDTWSTAATEAMTTKFREQQEKAVHYGTALGHMVGLGLAMGGEEGAKVAADTAVFKSLLAVSEAPIGVGERQWVWTALGPLQRLVAACDEAAAFPRELQRRVGDIKTALEGTSEASPDVPEDLVAKVAEAERLWEANARLAKDHLLGIIEDFLDYYSKGGHARPRAREVAKRCQRAIEDIPNLLQG